MRRAEENSGQILVVDDNEANRSLAQSALEDEGYDVVLASGGLDGIAAFERARPDCILLDVRMPDLDGFTVCERIRALPHGSETPVLFLTAARDLDTFDRALRVGGDDFLPKPIRPTELVVRVQNALKLRRLSVELREQYRELKQQRDAAQRVQLLKDRLSAFVVHDLKNPVNTMDLHAQVLLRDEGLSPDARESVVYIRSAARQLTRLILNLLDMSKADEGRLLAQRSEVDLRTLIDEVLLEIEMNARSRRIELCTAIEVQSVHVDRDLFRRTLTNLVENAIRYSPSDTVVTVTATRRSGGTEVRVSDSGKGIAPEMREKVFDAFAQVEPVGDGHAASNRGLGLTFCKLAIEAHAGQIWVEDGSPGAVFCMRLPDVS